MLNMTQDRFLAELGSKKGRFYVDSDGWIREKATGYCPIVSLLTENMRLKLDSALNAHTLNSDYRTAAMQMRMTLKLATVVVDAADNAYDDTHTVAYTLRVLMLRVLGLKEIA